MNDMIQRALLIIIIIAVIILIAVILQYIELQKFTTTIYNIETDKIKKDYHILFLSDLHCKEFGENNCRLIDAIKKENPDCILLGGDMITSNRIDLYDNVREFISQLSKLTGVYYALGNHEQRINTQESIYYNEFKKYIDAVASMDNVSVLDNESIIFDENIKIYALTIPVECYEKKDTVPLGEDFIKNTFGKPDINIFNIMLAHNPAFSELYAKWGADVAFSGHNHGGLIRIPNGRSFLSPQFELFPKYDGGIYDVQDGKVIVSKGLGTHSFHIRIFNRAELISVHLTPEKHNL